MYKIISNKFYILTISALLIGTIFMFSFNLTAEAKNKINYSFLCSASNGKIVVAASSQGLMRFSGNSYKLTLKIPSSHITYANKKFISLLPENAIYFSKDGAKWEKIIPVDEKNQKISLDTITYFKGKYIAYGSYCMLVTSNDLRTWKTVPTNFNTMLPACTYIKHLIVSNNTLFATTTDYAKYNSIIYTKSPQQWKIFNDKLQTSVNTVKTIDNKLYLCSRFQTTGKGALNTISKKKSGKFTINTQRFSGLNNVRDICKYKNKMYLLTNTETDAFGNGYKVYLYKNGKFKNILNKKTGDSGLTFASTPKSLFILGYSSVMKFK